jgi:acetyl-CoA acetyltransferase
MVGIVGVGVTDFSIRSGRTPLELAAEAGHRAIQDGGLNATSIDGIVGYHRNDSCSPLELAEALAIPALNMYVELLDGGPGSVLSIGVAASLVASGQCRAVLCYRALNGRSGHRIGQYGATSTDPLFQWMSEVGYIGVPTWYALWAQAYIDTYNLPEDVFWPVVRGSRGNASMNPAALKRQLITHNEYLESRMIASPLRLFDCCLETDAACAVIVTNASVATASPHPAWLRGWGASAPRGSVPPHDLWTNATVSAVAGLAPSVLDRAGYGLADVRYLQVYDNTSFSVCAILEDIGVCGRGEAGPYLSEKGMGPKSSLPINTNGGMLSEGHIHGLNGVVEAVRQVRGDAGQRQVTDCDVAAIVAWGFPRAAMAVLSRRP